ncbi:MAG: hypothetical protein NT038_05435 [Euryarchaeota archaeon]|nr:hypothetical protein [Euryarchaeota archaeon]
MEIIPFIHLKKNKIFSADQMLSVKEIKELVEEGKNLYVLDDDGIKNDEPNLTLYQQLSERYSLWIDNGPRNLDDVFDSVTAGATTILLRTTLWQKGNISDIQETVENMVYVSFDFRKQEPTDNNIMIPTDIEGVVIIRGNKSEESFKTDELVRTLCKKYKTYITDTDDRNETYWNSIGVQGLLIPIKQKETVNNDGI